MTADLSLFDPDPTRLQRAEAGWSETLATSLSYLGEVLEGRGQAGRERIDPIVSALRSGPASPWVTCLYSRLVIELSRSDTAAVERTLSDLVEASSLDPGSRKPVALDHLSVPESWWLQFRSLLDTDKKRVFRPAAPAAADEQACREEIDAALSFLDRADPASHRETAAILRLIVLGARSSDEPDQRFGAVSTFFMPGTVLVNARVRRSPVEMIDLLIHEASHLLLFGLCRDGSLIDDDGSARFASAARADPRPLDGIFHACFVSTRVHRALSRMLAGGDLRDGEPADARRESNRNRAIAAQTLETLDAHARPTPLGAEILSALRTYWATAENQAHAA